MTDTTAAPGAPPAAGGDLRSRSEFMAEAATLLAGSLDYEKTLETLAHLSVPRIGDWCAIDELDEQGRIRRIAVAHPDPARERLARELEERYPPDPDAPFGVPAVLRTGEPELVPEIPEELLRTAARDAEHERIIRDLGLRGYMVVPLRARGRMLGAITFVSAESGRRFGPDDLAFARDLADRAALAVDNARLLRAAEAARRQTERILESITDAFFVLDREWRFTYLNDEAARLLERPRAALRGRTLWEEFPDLAGTSFQENYERAVRERRTVDFEEHFAPHDAWYEVRAYPSDEGLAVYFRDVTDRVRAQEALRRQSTLTRTITENATSALFMMDARGHCTYMNPAAEEMTGYTLDEIRDMPLHDAIHHHHPDGRPYPVAECPIDRALPEDFSVRAHEDVFIRKDGEFFPVVCAAAPIFDDGGVPVGTVVEVRDVTADREAAAERERLIGALDAERERLADLFRDAPAFITVLRGPEHRFELANAAYLQLVGHREVVGRTVAEALPEVVEQGFIALLDGVYHGGEPFVGKELPVRLQRTPGAPMEARFVNFVYQPVREPDGSVSGIFVHGVDITDQVQAREEVQHKADELARVAGALEITNRELDQFAYVASHDLRAPLRGIANLSQWIEEDVGSDALSGETRQHLELMRRRVHRMEGLIDGILEYSRAGRVRDRVEPVDTAALVAEVLDLLDPPEEVRIEVEEGMPTLAAERLPLQQVFLNLLGNAVKYARVESPRIRVGWARSGRFWEFSVSDNGPGIAPEYHERIFGIFQTLQPRDQVEGTGIGLSLVRKIVESRGGRVWVESEEGRGAAFRFRIPGDLGEGHS
jgi:PAS domain S-box-containing protein